MWLASYPLGYLTAAVIGCIIFILCLRRPKNQGTVSKPIPTYCPNIKIFEVRTRKECAVACSAIRRDCNMFQALGFDCEWVSQRPVALIQLATAYGFCYLFRLNILGEIPTELEEILSDSEILKLGVSPLNDAKLLFKDYKIQVSGILDLRYLYPHFGGLASMATSVLGTQFNKLKFFQCSNWESDILSNSQLRYAAYDAMVAMDIFQIWLGNKKTFLTVGTSKFEEIRAHKLEGIDYQEQKKKGINYQEQKKKRSGYVTRQAPLYHNCFMHAPDGELLCSCDRRKAQWYVDRGLAEVLPGEPYSIKLLFEPAARAGNTNGGRYYQQLKQNCCVVCGTSHSYLKHHVVPQEYRKHFPNIMKDHQSHDVVLMCLSCHHTATQYNQVLRKQLAYQCNAPIESAKISNINKNVQKVKNSAKALLVSGDVIPKERKDFLENQVKAYYNVGQLTAQLLKNAANLKISTETTTSHGIGVVNYYKEHDGLKALEILWRKHFINTMKPSHLPALWSVTHENLKLPKDQV